MGRCPAMKADSPRTRVSNQSYAFEVSTGWQTRSLGKKVSRLWGETDCRYTTPPASPSSPLTDPVTLMSRPSPNSPLTGAPPESRSDNGRKMAKEAVVCRNPLKGSPCSKEVHSQLAPPRPNTTPNEFDIASGPKGTSELARGEFGAQNL